MELVKDSRGIGVFTASPGMEKSFALRCFAAGLDQSLYHMAYICPSTVSVMEFYRQFCAVPGVEDRGDKPGMFRDIQEQVYSLYKAKRQPLLLAVDEAQYLSTGILNDIKILMNHGYAASYNSIRNGFCSEMDLLKKKSSAGFDSFLIILDSLTKKYLWSIPASFNKDEDISLYELIRTETAIIDLQHSKNTLSGMPPYRHIPLLV